jgi:nitrate reductase assembly molybdenum cofactor insertion protein NarJ
MNPVKVDINPGPFVLASVITVYPDAQFQNAVGELLEDDTIQISQELRARLVKLASDSSEVDQLRSEYIAIFDHSKSLNPLYETEYGRERAMFKATELADIAGFYLAFGFEMHEDGAREMVDHLSVELEFYSLLLMKYLYLKGVEDREGCEIVFDGMKKFMDRHLGRFVSAILQRDGVRFSEHYREVLSWVNEIIENECARIGVDPEKATWITGQAEPEEVCCGGSVAMKQTQA